MYWSDVKILCIAFCGCAIIKEGNETKKKKRHSKWSDARSVSWKYNYVFQRATWNSVRMMWRANDFCQSLLVRTRIHHRQYVNVCKTIWQWKIASLPQFDQPFSLWMNALALKCYWFFFPSLFCCSAILLRKLMSTIFHSKKIIDARRTFRLENICQFCGIDFV